MRHQRAVGRHVVVVVLLLILLLAVLLPPEEKEGMRSSCSDDSGWAEAVSITVRAEHTRATTSTARRTSPGPAMNSIRCSLCSGPSVVHRWDEIVDRDPGLLLEETS